MSSMPPRNYASATGKPPVEKSKFAQTCNRLSLFLKEKGNLRDLSVGIHAKFDSPGTTEISISPVKTPAITPAENMTVDLLSHMENPGQKVEKSVNVVNLPQKVNLDSFCKPVENSKASSSKVVMEPKAGQMTIFYGGQVVVLEDVPVDRARDLMLAAQNNNGKTEKQQQRTELLASTSGGSPIDVSDSQEPMINVELQTKGSDLPIARRASLHKFLAKRKDRAAVRAPYQVHNMSPGGSSSGNEHSFDLNL